ncbi:hypothetical protein E4U52_004162 [Claviceps spartinae]|nr:hypothetical protein E4U52_004162 [Claviceps spartinae]
MTDTTATETMRTASASVPVSGAPQAGPGPICVHLGDCEKQHQTRVQRRNCDEMGGVDRWGRLDERDPRHWIVRVGAGVASHGRAKRRAASRGRVTTWECLPRWRACRTLQLAAQETRPAKGVGIRPAPAKLHLAWAQQAAPP